MPVLLFRPAPWVPVLLLASHSRSPTAFGGRLSLMVRSAEAPQIPQRVVQTVVSVVTLLRGIHAATTVGHDLYAPVPVSGEHRGTDLPPVRRESFTPVAAFPGHSGVSPSYEM